MILFIIGVIAFMGCLYAFLRAGESKDYPDGWRWAYIPFWGMPISIIAAAVGAGLWIAQK